MNVDHILRQKGTTAFGIAPERPLTDAVREMMHHQIGALLVMDGTTPVSIVTERDILWAVDRFGPDLDGIRVRDAMAPRLVTCGSGESIDAVMQMMLDNPTGRRIRHLPVVDGAELKGIISIGDVVQALLTETRFENRLLKNYIRNWPEFES